MDYNYYYDDRGVFTTESATNKDSDPPRNATRIPVPEKPWDDTWPQFVNDTWVLVKDFYGTTYWPKDAQWNTQGIVYMQHGPLPDGVLTKAPDKPFNTLKEDKNFERIMKFQEAETTGHLQSSVGFEINANRGMDTTLADLIAILEITGDATIDFRDYENSMHQVTLEQLKTMRVEVIQYLQRIAKKNWQYKDEILQATTKEALDAIVISF